MKTLWSLGLKTLNLLLCALLLYPPQLALAGPPTPAAGSGATVSSAGNGVPVVNIATPSASGLSHNKFMDYNVDPKGLVLNNGDKSQSFRQSQLAGLVAANPNLQSGNQARIILNEVLGGGRTTLAGFTEVLGGKADVIVANPFGITSSGGGFINTDRVSLVTGTPNITAGALNSFTVNGGDILITGTGINANAQQILDLVSRSVTIDGRVNAPELNIVAGRNTWSHASGAATALAPDGSSQPAWAIDSSALGGMYAGRISLKATEAGVGVRMQGEAAATADDFTITSAGKIAVTGKLSAARDMALTSSSTAAGGVTATGASLTAGRNMDLTANGGAGSSIVVNNANLFATGNLALSSAGTGAAAIGVTDSSVSANNDVSLTAAGGGATLTGGGLVADGDLSGAGTLRFTLGTLADTASATAGVTNANKRSGAATALNGTGAWLIDGVAYRATNALDLSTRSLNLGGAAATTFYSGGTMSLAAVEALTLGNAGLKSVGNMTLSATDPTTGLLNIGSLAQAQSTGGKMTLFAGRTMLNEGALTTTTGDIVIRSGSGLSFETRFTNQGAGSIWAGGQLNLADRDNLGTQKIAFKGTGKLGGTTVDINAGALSLFDSAVLTSVGDMSVTLPSGSGSTLAAGTKIQAVTGGVGTLYFRSTPGGWQSISNSGLIHSGQDIVADTMGVGGAPGSGGTLSAVRDISLHGHREMNGNYIAGRNLSISGASSINLFPHGDGSPDGMLSAGNDITINAYDFRNWSTMNAGHNITINASHLFFNAIGDENSFRLLYLDGSSGWTLVKNTTYVPKIIAGNAITINTGSRQSENVGLISAPTVNLGGAGMRNGGTISGGSINITMADFSNVLGTASSTPGGTPSATSLSPVPVPGGISFGGVTIAIPSVGSTSGLFVTSQNPSSSYLVESNPLYSNIDNFLGSDYLAEKYKFKADDVLKRLGDAGYETYLVRQQLITLTGSNIVVAGAKTEKAQMQALMDHAGSQAKALGLTYGKGLTASQQAGLKEDMVWMVETTVNGQKVLAPVVYLASSTRQLFNESAGGGLVTGDNINMNVATLNNSGTIRGENINVSATGDVRNVGGAIKGGDVSIASTGGSVINTAAVDEQVIKRSDGFIDLKTTVGKAGTIQGANKVSLAAAKNVENVGGSIKGKDVSLQAQGDVVNSAIVATNVSGTSYRETLAATGSIESTGDLKVQAGRDVQNLGGQMSAGGDASISAARDVTFDTVALTNRDISSSSTKSFVKNENKRTTTTTVTQVRGGVDAGGALSIKSGQDVTLAAANVSAGKSATIDAAADLNILARDNSVQTVSESNANGVGVGGGVFGKEKKTTDQFASRAVSSTLTTVKVGGAEGDLSNAKGSLANANTGGDINLSAGKTATLEGAKVNAAGLVNISGSDVKVLEARDVDRTTTHTETTSYLSISGGDGDKSATASKAGVKSDGVVKAGANASSTKDAGGVDFVKTTTTDTFDEQTRAVGSTLAAAGGLTITARKDATLRGADMKAGGDMSLTGQNVNILAAQDTSVSTSTSTTTKVGLYASTTNTADAKAGAGATAGAAVGSAGANAGATSNAGAASTNSLDVMRTKTTSTETVDITNKGTSLASGGSLRISGGDKITVQGSDLSGDKGVDLKAKDMAFLAAQDTHTSTTTTSKTSAGLYLDGNAAAAAGANAGANAGLGANAGAKAETSAGAVASLGVQGKNVVSSSTEGTSTARVSTITSGAGSISRTAQNSITDVGTAIDAAGNFSQSAKTIVSKAAENTSYSTTDSTTNTGKVGVYAKAEAGASAEAGANAGLGLDGKPKAEAGAGAEVKAKVGAGVKVAYNRDTLSTGETSSEAVVSTIRAGGKIASSSADKTSLEGTQLSAGKGVEIEAGSLDFSAAKNTATTRSSASNVNAQASAGVSRGTGKGVDVDVAAAGSKSDRASSASNAVTGSIESGGDIVIKTKGDTRLEGTNLAGTGDTTVNAGGNLVFAAARDTTSASKSAFDASVSVSTSSSKGAGGSSSTGVDAAAAGGFSKSASASSTARAGSVNTGGKLNLSAGKAATFEGTNLAAGGDATISGKDGVTMSAARSTTSSDSVNARVGVEAGKGSESTATESSRSKSAGGTAEGGFTRSRESIAEAGSVTSGGSLKIVSGKDVTLEGTNLAAQDKASINAGGSVNFKAAESTSESQGFQASVSGSASSTDKTPAAAAKPASAASAPKPKNPGTGGTQGSDGSKQSNQDLASWQKGQASVVQQLKDKQAQSGAPAGGAKTPPPVPTAPKPERKTGAGAQSGGQTAQAQAAEATTEKESSASVGVQFQMKNKTVQKAGSISAGAGGVEITAGGGDVNLVGTNIGTSGDASISAARDVNISATRSTDSSFGANVAASADRKSETPKGPTGASAQGGAQAAPKKTPPPVPTAPKPERKTVEDAPGAPKKTPPPVPTAPKPERKTGTDAAQASTAPAEAVAPAAPSPEAKDSSTFGAKASASSTTAKDPDNTSSAFVGVGGGGSVKNQGAVINTGGKLNIKSGGKTTLTNTSVQAASGENIDAAGGVERKTERDSSVFNASTDSGPAGTGMGVSKVPMAGGAAGTGAPGAPGTPGTPGVGGSGAGTDSTQGAPSGTSQSNIKAAQGGSSGTPGIKKP
ncbi:MAG: hemagglutinin repeat-containing protein [Humidesulfovibrio sp.]|uniref:hemagglutinin repeat-containing protein n=1 Tax=Humidesulfovibrio sp. TaxID=2910988 RepID=UPI0027369FF9|nr:hemagglutinin repeat-containing protein [Humidesulfovibrio sp.]MDP2849301.1 hemagglutinin repeat-containing protein [Humidesulfovibrio sp.]